MLQLFQKKERIANRKRTGKGKPLPVLPLRDVSGLLFLLQTKICGNEVCRGRNEKAAADNKRSCITGEHNSRNRCGNRNEHRKQTAFFHDSDPSLVYSRGNGRYRHFPPVDCVVQLSLFIINKKVSRISTAIGNQLNLITPSFDRCAVNILCLSNRSS